MSRPRLVDAINLMGGVGEKAEACYQQALDGLARRSKEAIQALAEEYEPLEARQYLDRWASVHLLAELRHEASLDHADRLLSSRIPEEQSADPHRPRIRASSPFNAQETACRRR